MRTKNSKNKSKLETVLIAFRVDKPIADEMEEHMKRLRIQGGEGRASVLREALAEGWIPVIRRRAADIQRDASKLDPSTFSLPCTIKSGPTIQ